MPSNAFRLFGRLSAFILGLMPIKLRRELIERLVPTIKIADDIAIEHGRVGGISGLWINPPNPDGVVLYLHGGAYVLGSARTEAPLMTTISSKAKVRIFLPDYRLAPEHPFPACLDDVLAVYLKLLDATSPKKIVIGGGSAGGGLALALGLALKDKGKPLPAGIAVMSPWADLTLSGESHIICKKNDVITRGGLANSAKQYLNRTDAKNYLASPVFGRHSGMPPLLLQAGGAEILLDDSRRVAKSAEVSGVPVTLKIYEEMFHGWQVFKYPQSEAAMKDYANWITRQLRKSAEPL